MKKFLFTISISLSAFILNTQITFQKTFGGTLKDYGYFVKPFTIFLLFFFLFIYSEIRAQNLNDFCIGIPVNIDVNSVIQTSDNNYIVAGTSTPGPLALNCYIRKVTANGTVLWSKEIDATTNTLNDYCWDVCETASGSYLLCGESPSNVGYCLFLAEVDTSGALLKSRKYKFTDQVEVYSIAKTYNNGFAVTGNTGSDYLYFGLLDSNLNMTLSQRGGISRKGNSIIQTQDSGFAIGGEAFNNGLNKAYFMKLDAGGNIQWTRILSIISLNSVGYAYSVIQTDFGDYILCGTTHVGTAAWNIFLVKFSNSGNLLWSKTFSPSGPSFDNEATSIVRTHDSGYAITGFTSSSKFIMKFDQNDSLLWSNVYAFPGIYAKRIIETNDHGIVIAGNLFLTKTDSIGNNCCMNTATFVTDTGATYATGDQFISFYPTQVDTTATIAPGDISTTVYCITSDVEQLHDDNATLVISPNPSKGNFDISFERMIAHGNVKILNILGKTIFTGNISNESKEAISLKNIALGIYFVKVFDGEKSYCRKLIVE